MAGGTTAYTRFVRAMRVLLPLAALGILSTLFLIADRVDTSNPFAFEDLDISDVLLQPGITSPRFAGQTAAGETVRLSAANVIEASDGALTATDLSFTVEDTNGAKLALSALQGRIDRATDVAEFSGKVMLETSSGYELATELLHVARDMSWMQTVGPVEARAPFGAFTAGSVRVERNLPLNGEPSYRLLFQDGVKLVYTRNR